MSPSMMLQAQGVATALTRLNLRRGAPSVTAPVVRTLEPGARLQVAGVVVGEPLQGNPLWFALEDGPLAWTGGCGPLKPMLPTAGGDLAQSPSTIAHLAITPNVVDLYHADRVTSFTEAAGGGVLGVIHKATTGETGRDDAYKDRRSAARQAGLLWGAYHWGTTRPAAAQLDNFLTWAQPDETTLVALDFERSNENQMSLDLAREFLSLAEEKLGRKAVLYSGDLVKAQLGGAADPFFRSHRLWLAQYGPRPEVQASWSSFWLWQYTDGVAGPPPHQAPGFGGPGGGGLDCNYYPGDAERLAAEWAS